MTLGQKIRSHFLDRVVPDAVFQVSPAFVSGIRVSKKDRSVRGGFVLPLRDRPVTPSFDRPNLAGPAEVADAIARGLDQALPPDQQVFLFMPFMHSEALADQERSVRLFQQPGLEQSLGFARHHRGLIQRFGRFPHRNAILGRANTAEEVAYLASPEAFHG